MKCGLPLSALALVLCVPVTAEAACTPTGYIRDGIDLTAALINPWKVSGDVNATGCNIGIYYSPSGPSSAVGRHGHFGGYQVRNANIHGANYYGIVNNGVRVDIENSTISDIGEKPFNGAQHGVAIYFAFDSAARGDIKNNTIWNYQKGGIVVNGTDARADVEGNTVIGLGPVSFIAQNGIQAGYGARVKIERNFVAGNSYTGTSTASGGILLVGGACYGGDPQTNTKVERNTATNNDVGIWFSNLDGTCNPVATPTKNSAERNKLVQNAINNPIYQAGISDQGNYDEIERNDICGPGYPEPPTATLFAIDVTFTNNPKVKHNTFCEESVWGWPDHHGKREARALRAAGTRTAAPVQ